eukprot:139854_1
MTVFSSHNRAENCWMQCRAQPRPYYVALILLLIAYLFNLVAIPINRLTTVRVTNVPEIAGQESTEWESYCAWNNLEHGATIGGKPKHNTYATYCHETGLFCDASTKGKIWLGMSIAAAVLGVVCWIGILRELCKDSKLFTLIAMGLYSCVCIVNVIVYLVQGGGTSQCAEDVCDFLNEAQPYNCQDSWGLSVIFMLIAGICGTLSAIFTALVNYDSY